MTDQLRANGPKPINKGGRPKCWFSDWYEATHMPKKTAQRMWWEFQYFCDVLATPAQADTELQLRFFQWWNDRNEQDRALKAADPVAYKAAMLARSLELREALKPANKAARKERLHIASCQRFLDELRANGPKPDESSGSQMTSKEKGPVISDQPKTFSQHREPTGVHLTRSILA